MKERRVFNRSVWVASLLVTALLIAVLGAAAAAPFYQTVPIATVWSVSGNQNIPFGTAANQLTYTFPAVPTNGNQVVVLKFRTRYPVSSFGGWNNILSVLVNNQVVDSKTVTGVNRLLDRQFDTAYTSDPNYPTVPFFAPYNGQTCLLVLFSNTWTAADPRFTTDGAELYTYLLNISDLVSAGQSNQLTLMNMGNAGTSKPYLPGDSLWVDSLQVGTVARSDYNQLAYDPYYNMSGFQPTCSVAQGGTTLEVTAQGGMRVSYGGERYYACSEFSEPGSRILYNDLSWVTRGVGLYQGTGAVQVTPQDANSILVRLTGSAYTLSRTLTLDGSFVRVTDNYTNPTGAAVGLMLENDFFSEQQAQRWYVGGKREKASESDWEATNNPSGYLMQNTSGLGVAVKDTVLRMRLENAGSKYRLSMNHRHFGLAAGASYTAQWQLYAGPAGYFNFVNAVRRDWHVNYTIPGLWSFWDFTRTDMQAGYLNNPGPLYTYLNRYKIDIFALCPWFEYYFAPMYWQPRSVYHDLIQNYMNNLKLVKPTAKCIANLESFLYYAPLSLFNGNVAALPPNTSGDYMTVLNSAATAAINATPWNDSILRNSTGMGIIDRYYASRYSDTGVNLQVYPTGSNYWQTKFMDMMSYVLNDCGLDGVYIDSFGVYSDWTIYNVWDGRSVDVNGRTGQIDRQYTNGGLVSNGPRAAWIQYALNRGKLVFTNGYSDTAEIQTLPKIGFCEAEYSFDPADSSFHNAEIAATGQLSSPLALGVRTGRYPSEDPGKLIQKAVIAYLRQGMLYCHYYTNLPSQGQTGYGECGAINYMFPFTPVELGEGYAIGSERIVTCISRTFHWPSAAQPTCKRFDLSGLEMTGGFTITPSSAGGWDVQVQLNDWQQTAVIMGNSAYITGTVVPAGYMGDLGIVGLKVQVLRNGAAVQTNKLVLNGDGTFSVPSPAPGTYDIAVKSPCYLRRLIPAVAVSSGVTDLGTISLPAGDGDGNNVVDSTDLAIALGNLNQAGN